jgi:hypothetical protein
VPSRSRGRDTEVAVCQETAISAAASAPYCRWIWSATDASVAPGCFQRLVEAQALDPIRLLAVAAAPVATAARRKDRRVN